MMFLSIAALVCAAASLYLYDWRAALLCFVAAVLAYSAGHIGADNTLKREGYVIERKGKSVKVGTLTAKGGGIDVQWYTPRKVSKS